jgi:RND family efflux transporter MFP subunit
VSLLAYVYWSGWRRFSSLAWLLFAAIALVTSACESNYPAAAKQSQANGEELSQQVKAITVKEMPLERTVSVLGSLAAYDQAALSTKVPGRVARIPVDFGSGVEQGQILAEIEPRDYQLQEQQAEAALAQARVRLGLSPTGQETHIDPEQTATVKQARAVLNEANQKRDRFATLVEKDLIARAEFDAADAAYKVALSQYQNAIEEIRNRQALLMQRRSELEIARQRLADTIMRAPFDGVIQIKAASVGQYLAAGAHVVTLVRMDPLRLRADVPERATSRVQAGQKVRVIVEGNPRVYEGQVMRVGPTINEQNRMLTVEADVRNRDHTLRPGAFAQVEIVTDEADLALTVPTSAVVTFAGLEKVLLVNDGKAVEKSISTGQRTTAWTEVTEGVQSGDLVIVEPGNLRSGQPVSVIQ